MPWLSEAYRPSRAGGYCCEAMRSQVTTACDVHRNPHDCPDRLVVRLPDGTIAMPIHDGGTSSIRIAHCPWCGLARTATATQPRSRGCSAACTS